MESELPQRINPPKGNKGFNFNAFPSFKAERLTIINMMRKAALENDAISPRLPQLARTSARNPTSTMLTYGTSLLLSFKLKALGSSLHLDRTKASLEVPKMVAFIAYDVERRAANPTRRKPALPSNGSATTANA